MFFFPVVNSVLTRLDYYNMLHLELLLNLDTLVNTAGKILVRGGIF